MTYTNTHLALQGILIWILLSKKSKEYYKEHRWEFLLINLFAILPDIDLLFGLHRSYTHSLILPLAILLCCLMVGKIGGEFSKISEKGLRIIRFIKLACYMYILHIILDIGWGPVMFFWPLDANYYDLSVFLRLENVKWLFLPMTFIGLIPSWKVYTYSEGLNRFFINLSQDDRQSIYGQYLDFNIEYFIFHVIIFIAWIIVILLPVFKRKRQKERSNFTTNLVKGFKQITRETTLVGVLILTLGLILGPSIGRSYSVSHVVNVDYVASNTLFDPTLGVIIDRGVYENTTLSYKCKTGLVDYNASVMFVEEEPFNDFFNSFSNISSEYQAGNISYTELIVLYSVLVDDVKNTSNEVYQLIGDQNQLGLDFFYNSSSVESKLHFLALIDEWNWTESYVYRSTLTISHTLDRRIAQIEGAVLVSLACVIILLDQSFSVLRIRKKTEKKIS